MTGEKVLLVKLDTGWEVKYGDEEVRPWYSCFGDAIEDIEDYFGDFAKEPVR